MSAGVCEVSTRRHSPGYLTVEDHHFIPVAWQQFWRPAVAPFPGKDQAGRGLLWDARTIVACPTEHRNVHDLIVAMMREVAASALNGLPKLTVPRSHREELAVAEEGLSRYLGAGGDLLALTAAGEWGQS